MNIATKKWLVMKLTSGILIPLMIWFIINFVSIFDGNYSQLINFFSNTTTKILFSLFLISAFTFSLLTISEIFEDYISEEKLKNLANKLIFFFGVAIPLFTIICLVRI